MLKCPRPSCPGVMRKGKALLNTPEYGTPDFPGQTDLRGQTFTMTGPAGVVAVLKCSVCGHSVQSEKSWKEQR